MAKTVLRILVSDPSELNFVLMNCLESRKLVDRVLVVEHDYSHSGKPLRSNFLALESEIQKLSGNPCVEVHFLSIEKEVIKNAISSDEMHFNENLIRKSFLKECNISTEDLIFAVDADEIIYRGFYRLVKLLRIILFRDDVSFSLMMHQFFYKMNYLWKEVRFRSPVLVSAKLAIKDANLLRDSGSLLPFWVGCHFSWQLTVEQMINKLKHYAHSPEYLHLANEETLKDAIENLKYPFDTERPFTIRILDERSSRRFLPNSFFLIRHRFSRESWGKS
jgi:hypothetical protein